MPIPSKSDDRLPLPPSRSGQVLLIVSSWFIQHVSVDFRRRSRFPDANSTSNIQLSALSLFPAMLTSLAPLPIVFAWSTDYVSYLADAAGNCKGLYLGVVIAYRRSQGLWA
jgi:hypothetical protein